MYTAIIVDDERICRTSLQSFMEKNTTGFTVCAAFPDGSHALDYLAENAVDLVITDIRMLQVSGLELSRQIHDRWPNTNIIIISGFSDFDYARRAIEYGVRRYILKPIDFAELAACLAEVASKLDAARRQDAPLPASEAPGDTAQAADTTLIENIQRYVQQNYMHDISREDVAKAVYISPAYLSRLFKAHYSMGFVEYLAQVRIGHATQLLGEHIKINEIAKRVGYRNRNTFLVNFRQCTGVTPSEYRQRTLQFEGDGDEMA